MTTGRRPPAMPRPAGAGPAAVSGWPIGRLLPLIVGTLVALAVVPVIVLGWLGARENYRMNARERVEITMSTLLDRVRGHLDPVADQLVYIAAKVGTGRFDPLDPAARRAVLSGAIGGLSQSLGLSFITPEFELIRYDRMEGEVAERGGPDSAVVRETVRTARAGTGVVWGAPYYSTFLRRPILTARIALRGPAGEDKGVLVAALAVSDLGRFLTELPIRGLNPFLLYGEDRVLAHRALAAPSAWGEVSVARPLPLLAEFRDPVLAVLWSAERNSVFPDGPSPIASGHWSWVGENTHAFYYAPLAGYGPQAWTVGWHTPGVASRRERWTVSGIVIGGVGVLLAAIGAAIVVARRISRPLTALAADARRIEAMEFDAVRPPPATAFREINEASHAFGRLGPALRWFETYMPRTLVRRLVATGRDVPAPETRIVTVMFTDLEGYTAFAAGRDAAEIADYLNGVFAALGTAVEHHGGTIDKYIGDAVMAIWGAPEDQLDHAARAVRAAVEGARAAAAFNAAQAASGQPTCRVRIGVHSGPALVGNIGFAGRMSYTAIGETVNLAQRLEQYGKHCIAAGAEVVAISGETADEVRAVDPSVLENFVPVEADRPPPPGIAAAWCQRFLPSAS